MSFEKFSSTELVNQIILEKVAINDLNLLYQKQREAFLEVIERRPNLLKKIKKEELLKYAIELRPDTFIYLEEKQYTDALAQIYLLKRLENTPNDRNRASGYPNPKINIQKSVDEKIVLNYAYTSADDDELYYFDNELMIPTSLKSSIKVSLKMTDAVAFIATMDTHITELGKHKIHSTISDIIENTYKECVYSYIVKNKVGYYTLCTSCNEIGNNVLAKLKEEFKPYGINATEFIVKRLAIPQNVRHKLEDQALAIRQKRQDVEADAEFAKISMTNYEAKLAIEKKYPDTTHSLTEYEKDLALNRYLIKTGRKYAEAVDRSISLHTKSTAPDSVITKERDLVPDVPQPKNIFKTAYLWLLCITALIGFIILANNFGAGCIVLGIVAAIFGTIAAFNHKKFITEKIVELEDKNEAGGTENNGDQ